jgi:dihydroorotase/allantoinase
LKVDLVVKNARIVSPRGIVEGGLAVEGGVVVAVAKDSHLPEGDRVIDAGGKYILPGVLDGHAHTYLPPETPSTGTRAAAKGGITTLLEMPGTQMGCFSPAEFEKKRDLFKTTSHVDFCIHAGCASGYPEGNLTSIYGQGATGFKFFISSAGPKWPQTFDGEVLDRLAEIARFGGLALIHSENDAILRDNLKRLQAAGRKDFAAHLEHRPPISEIESGQRMITFLKATGCRGMLVHTSLPEVVEDVHRARLDGVRVLTETCPQYLYLTDEDVTRNGPWNKFAPPARGKEDKAAIRRMLADGHIDSVATDHAPYSKERKLEGMNDIFAAPNGMPGLETFVHLMLNGVSEGWITLERLAAVLAENPARIYGIYPKKGALIPGADADMVICDMNKVIKIRNDDQITACGWTPYDGMTVKGAPVMSIIRGEVSMEDDAVHVKEGSGVFVPRNTL